uniref:Uncharacterized protein n=1 Tax=Cannabis sativa TaxID=3483 RepID=A0A803RAH3_CANSA
MGEVLVHNWVVNHMIGWFRGNSEKFVYYVKLLFVLIVNSNFGSDSYFCERNVRRVYILCMILTLNIGGQKSPILSFLRHFTSEFFL